MKLSWPGLNLVVNQLKKCERKCGKKEKCLTSMSQVILELEPGAAEQPDSRGKNFLHTAIIKVGI